MSLESQPAQPTNTTPVAPQEEKKLKPCCACPETKKARDQCVFDNGEENCSKFIEAHKECLRSHGFKI
ncbi:Cytochrome c oxidase copper chaperone [Basidiobolus ranarum]|uniref:Cytochrome c oxidase copper chaperone n=1 Tax=Basidiobolus ranarum TaxID=34480 RepID=A0ABR2WQN0_9FUNG